MERYVQIILTVSFASQLRMLSRLLATKIKRRLISLRVLLKVRVREVKAERAKARRVTSRRRISPPVVAEAVAVCLRRAAVMLTVMCYVKEIRYDISWIFFPLS